MEEVKFFILLFKCLCHLIRCPFFDLVHFSLHSVTSFLRFLLTELSSLFPGSFFPHTHLPRSDSRMTLLVGLLTHEAPPVRCLCHSPLSPPSFLLSLSDLSEIQSQMGSRHSYPPLVAPLPLWCL